VHGATHPKLLDLPALAAAAERHRRAGRSLVLCHGCFDVVHPGHLRYLQFAARQGDVLVVSITGDDAVEPRTSPPWSWSITSSSPSIRPRSP
jgi:cytidyltransferase-like protein